MENFITMPEAKLVSIGRMQLEEKVATNRLLETIAVFKKMKDAPVETSGICGQISYKIQSCFPWYENSANLKLQFFASHFMDISIIDWPQFSGDIAYFIPGRHEAFHENHRKGTLWQGQQGRFRHEAVDFLINAEKMLDSLNNGVTSNA